MEIIDILQNSQEWHDWRHGKIGSSDAATVMGENPFKTPYKLWREIMGFDPKPYISEAMKHGSEKEGTSRKQAEDILGKRFPSVCAQSTSYPWMIASLDGLSDDMQILELKNPFKADVFFNMLLKNEVPSYYIAQLQHQMAVTGLSFVHFFAFYDDAHFYQKVYRDDQYIEKLIETELEFMNFVKTGTPPPFSKGDYQNNCSSSWVSRGEEYKSIMARISHLEAQAKSLKEAFLEESAGVPTKGGGVTVYPIQRSGNVDMKRLENDIKLYGININEYRGSSSTSWGVRISD